MWIWRENRVDDSSTRWPERGCTFGGTSNVGKSRPGDAGRGGERRWGEVRREGWYINAEEETWGLIIIKGLRGMQYSEENPGEVDRSFANGSNEEKQGGSIMFKVELSLQQATFLGKLLPTCYSLQFENKPTKRTASSQKNIKVDPLPSDPRRKPSKVPRPTLRKTPNHLLS